MSESARMLDDTLHRLLGRRLSDPSGTDDPQLAVDVARELTDAGFDLLLAAEADGGSGSSLTDAATVAWRAGRHAAPVDIVAFLLTPLVGGGVLVPPSPATRGPADAAPAADGDSDATILPRAGMPLIRGADGGLSPLPVPAARAGMLLACAALTGAMAHVLDIAVDYANTRTQFGRPLARFQAIQHLLAQAASELAATEAVLAAALEAADEGVLDERLILSAKAQAGHAATMIAATGHQLFGAIGFTREHELHRFTRYLWALRDDWGRQADCDLALGRAGCAAPQGLWPFLVDQERTVA